MKTMSVKKIVMAGVLTAMCVVITLLIRIPLVPSVPFLQYDGKDVLIVMAGFIYGAGYVALISVLVSVLEIVFMGGTIIDVLMNVISTCAFACTAAWIYKRKHTKTGALIGLAAGTVITTIAMVIWNYIMDPIYFQMPREAVVSMLPAIALFNVLKFSLNSGIALFIYKPVVTALRRYTLIPESTGTKGGKSMMYAGAFILVTAVVLCLGISGIL